MRRVPSPAAEYRDPSAGGSMMEELTGTISQAGNIVLRDVPISIERCPPSERAMGWQGDFIVPEGQITPEVGGIYELELSDGRSGAIFIESARVGGPRRPNIHFQTIGRFA
jgi:hypothetical protein